MDPYSLMLTTAVDRIMPSVMSIEIERRDKKGRIRSGHGSGFILAPDGFLLTNSHVINRALKIRAVRATTGTRFKAEVIGDDPETDLAVLRVNSNLLTPASLGDSDKLKVGQLVLAVGNPLGFESSVTTGIVSGLKREFKSQNGRNIQDVIQTNAAMNPGNSGGPLIDTEGNVVGVCAAIILGTQGICFAIGINTVKIIAGQLIRYGKIPTQ